MSEGVLGLLVNAAATWFMCGVIWLVQLVHYPLFRHYERDTFRTAMIAHQNGIRFVVAGPMLVELITSILLVMNVPHGVPVWECWLGVGLAGVWVASTAALQIPQHERLARSGWDESLHRRLVRLNWLRTAAWTARAVLCAAMLGQVDVELNRHTELR